ncbi:MAG: bifunctional ADP-dependent NAD(P)H-hydrate dehydratase/NAD(P)H-hydrate epimerase [Rhodobacteraceae bacterium]|jgi:hydroxyethylthiazole kinase-like uncharacterized protein yjeF|nr:bifunctional ADP-dependent NAD(P)H-hydrate dehydratase/NAD(P)H-hydrate epimerase [Paracoccaceae bacterium]
MELLTAAQMRAIETEAIARGAVTGLDLMERAGQGVVEAILAEWPELAGGRRGALPPGAGEPRPVDMVHGRSGLNDVHRTSFRAALTPPGYLGEDEGAGGPLRAVVLCGPGNNGGDGFVVARLLRERGWEVAVQLLGDPERLPPDARVNFERWCATGQVGRLHEEWLFEGAALAVDALFGTGLTRTTNCVGGTWTAAKKEGCRLVAIDIVSGVCADSGRFILQDADHFHIPRFDLTVTFERPKLGHVLADGADLCGKLRVVPLGLSGVIADMQARRPGHRVFVEDAEPFVPGLIKDTRDHKYTHGHALILSGPPGHGGAARLAARGALRIGAGVVTLGCPPEAIPENAARLDAIMLRPVADAAGLAALLGDPRITALCLGPGMGTGEREADLVAAALGIAPQGVPGLTRDPDPERPVVPEGGPGSRPGQARGSRAGRSSDKRPALVLDADALTILSRRPDLFAALHPGCILTPHAGEFARLFPDIAAKLAEPATRGPAYSKVDATREAAARAGCVVLFKGPDTVIADPHGRCAVSAAHHDRAAPWLATAGSGDVLAGFITGCLARGIDPLQAAETAAWLHVEAARSFGPGLIAEDLPEELPKVLRALGL